MKNKSKSKAARSAARKAEQEGLKALQARIDAYDATTDDKTVSLFGDLPISEPTVRGLTESSFVAMTDIQKKTIPQALKGEDIMATARTGSGKTLAFLVPTIEALIRAQITEYDGLAALIVSPTRELAVQIFEVLAKIGRHNTFSAALVTGGKDVQYEKERVGRMNILVGTPGRIAQHLNESVGLETANLQVLVLDEADRCLDMGFKKQIDSIMGHLPPTRQTLLFLATQSESVQALARLSLTNPQRIGTSSDREVSATPDTLEQAYVVVGLDEKLDMLWSFIKSHLKSKVIVFFSSSRQVQYAYESFRTLQPGISLLRLYGRHKQQSRLETTAKFAAAQHAVLFATDIVARGLDFPAVDWVVQLDCPEDAATYVHRVGRAARFGRQGRSLLMLMPSENEGFLKRLKVQGIEPKLMTVKLKSKKSIRPQLQLICFKDPVMKNLAQRTFVSYFRSVHVQKDKDVFSVAALPADKYAASLGLPGAPRIKLKGDGSAGKDRKNALRQLMALAEEGKKEAGEDTSAPRTKYDRMFQRQNQTVLLEQYRNMTQLQDAEDSDEDFMQIKRRDHALGEELPSLDAPVSKRAAKKALSKKLLLKGNPTKLKFDDDGVAHPLYELEDEEAFHAAGAPEEQKEAFVAKSSLVMESADVDDKATARAKRQEKKRKRKEAERRRETWEDELERDMESDELGDRLEGEPEAKKPRWFERDDEDEDEGPRHVELDAPESLEDLEALTQKLIE